IKTSWGTRICIPRDENHRQLLVQRRHELGLSQQQLADKLNVMQVSICHLETGKTKPTPELLSKVCEALDLE
ncbi:MAG TPA: helix-turn-helix transcriptional regulator, partial [Lacipirellulaceae bacterium]|nr:helix-turn-helix transcriptional regulator [Lacipirellulaceae bacterium]